MAEEKKEYKIKQNHILKLNKYYKKIISNEDKDEKRNN
jgi:hypothetical protein